MNVVMRGECDELAAQEMVMGRVVVGDGDGLRSVAGAMMTTASILVDRNPGAYLIRHGRISWIRDLSSDEKQW